MRKFAQPTTYSENVIRALWNLDDEEVVDANTVRNVLTKIAANSERPIIVELAGPSASMLNVVLGDGSGTVLSYFPPGEPDAPGFLHSVGPVAHDEPELTADYRGNLTGFSRAWVVPHEVGLNAASEFCQDPLTPPPSVEWMPD